MSKDRLLSDEELAKYLADQEGYSNPENVHTQSLVNFINTQKRLYAESLRSKDPHLCEFGHEVYSHKTVDGWCCACESDQAFMKQEIEGKAN